ncbi:MAG: MFS transporter [Sphingomonadaceae bacterium]|nr:MFS transporter [Sphingomonadaceae bacterium]
MSTGNSADRALGRAAMNKAFWRILPLILIAYLCAYMDRVNVSFAAAQMNQDLQFSATIYGLGGGLFFLGYALFEIPSNLMLVRFGARQWIARIMITWGLLSAAMMFVQTPLQFYVLRFLLGVAEAGFYPGVIFYFASWFPPCHRSRAVSRFFIASPLASVVMGAVSGWLLGLDGTGGLEGWQWLFLVQGLPTVLFGLIVWRCLPDSPASSHWLSQPEKDWIQRELAREQALIGEPARHNVLAAFRNPRVLLLGAIGFTAMCVVTTIVLNAPLVLAETGRLDVSSIGYIVGLGGLLGVAAILICGNLADRAGYRWSTAAWCCAGLGVAVLTMGLSTSTVPLAIGYLMFATFCFAVPSVTSSGWPEALHVRELAVGAAAINTISQIGAFSAPFAWGLARDATGSFQPGLIALSLVAAILTGLILLMGRQMRRREPRTALAVA